MLVTLGMIKRQKLSVSAISETEQVQVVSMAAKYVILIFCVRYMQEANYESANSNYMCDGIYSNDVSAC